MAAVRSAEKSDLRLKNERVLRAKKTKKDGWWERMRTKRDGWWERMREEAQVRVPDADIHQVDDECRVCGAK